VSPGRGRSNVLQYITRRESHDPYDDDGGPGTAGGRFELQRMTDGVPAVDGNRRQRHHRHGYRDRLQRKDKTNLYTRVYKRR